MVVTVATWPSEFMKTFRNTKSPVAIVAFWKTDGYTAFHFACTNGHLKVHKSAQLNIDLNAKDDYGQTAFRFACANGHFWLKKVIE